MKPSRSLHPEEKSELEQQCPWVNVQTLFFYHYRIFLLTRSEYNKDFILTNKRAKADENPCFTVSNAV
jgi:hypothetical protein